MADRIAGIATIVLFISLFLSWFGITVLGITVTASGVSAHGWLYVVMILDILVVAYLALRAGWDELPFSVNIPHLTLMMVATIVNLVLVFIAFIDKPGGSGVGWEFGAFLALIAAVVAAAPYAIPQLRAKTM
jgi:phosphoglycerol transferase MdoB-like AlkP superfamily enzyme